MGDGLLRSVGAVNLAAPTFANAAQVRLWDFHPAETLCGTVPRRAA